MKWITDPYNDYVVFDAINKVVITECHFKDDAKLCAAAPELLAALELLVDPANNEVYVEFEKILKKKERQQIQSAINKAKGL